MTTQNANHTSQAKTLFDNLMALVEDSTVTEFYFVDQKNSNGTPVRIFGYRFASYSDWLKPSALEARGITFDITDIEKPKILCRPMQKFFNLNENPFTADLDISKTLQLMDKADGSLISFYYDNGLQAKSKMSCSSDQAIAALNLAKQDPKLAEFLEVHTKLGYTFNFEYVAPNNRVVVFYDKAKLILLNVRENLYGNYVDREAVEESLEAYDVSKDYLVEIFDHTKSTEIIQNSKDLVGVEGYVGVMNNVWFKVKTPWYLALHKVKDQMTAPSKTLIAIAEEAYDDLYSLSGTDAERAYLDIALDVYTNFLNEQIQAIEGTHRSLMSEDRKTYAIEGRKIVSNETFWIYMKMYTVELSRDEIFKMLKETFIKKVDNFVDLLVVSAVSEV